MNEDLSSTRKSTAGLTLTVFFKRPDQRWTASVVEHVWAGARAINVREHKATFGPFASSTDLVAWLTYELERVHGLPDADAILDVPTAERESAPVVVDEQGQPRG